MVLASLLEKAWKILRQKKKLITSISSFLEATKSAILPELVELTNDEESYVRNCGLETVVNILSLVDDDTCRTTLIPLVCKFCQQSLKTEDVTLPVVAREFGRLCHGFSVYLTDEQKCWFVDFFKQLSKVGLSDNKQSKNRDIEKDSPSKEQVPILPDIIELEEQQVECRKNCAFNFPERLNTPLRMEFLSQLDDNKQQRELIETLENKKMQLQQQLQNLQNELSSFDCGLETPDRSQNQTTTDQCRQVIDAYRYIGVSTKHTLMKEDSLVLQFDPLYKGQAPSCYCYHAEIKMTSNGHQLGQHNIPPFIPVKQFSGKNLSVGCTKEFVQETQNYLQSYVQRREGIKHVQVEYKDQGITRVEVDLPMTHIKVTLSVDKDWPDLTVTLNYNLSEVMPNMVSIDIDESAELQGKNKDKLYRLITRWKTKFIQQDLYTAFSEVLKDLKKM